MSDKMAVKPGDTVRLRLPWSEAVMHLGLADQVRPVQLTPTGMAQILTPEGAPVSFPVTCGEVGIYYTPGQGYHAYPAA